MIFRINRFIDYAQMFLVPLNRAMQSFPEWHLCSKPKLSFCPAYIKAAFWLAIWF